MKKKKDTNTECELTFMCPAIGKCKQNGIYTRKNKDNCVCSLFRDNKKGSHNGDL